MEHLNDDHREETRRRLHWVHYQIGAPALIYREKMDPNSGFLQIPEHKYPRHNGTEVAELIQRRNRIGTRWYYSMDDVPYIPRRHKKRKHSSSYFFLFFRVFFIDSPHILLAERVGYKTA